MVIRTLVCIALIALMGATQASAPSPELYHTIQTQVVKPDLEAVNQTTFSLVSRDTTIPADSKTAIRDKGCGATAVADNVVLTATHCLANKGDAMNVVNLDYEHAVYIKVRVDDGDDNSLLLTNGRFPHHTKISTRPINRGDEIFIFGNPGELRNMYRKGEIMGMCPDANPMVSPWILADMNIGKGDSGSAIFNNYGEVIGTVSEVDLADPTATVPYKTVKYMAWHPFNFTKEQLKAVGLTQ